VNGLAAAAAVAACAALPPGAELRVLEIGAGTGGTSGALIRALPPDRARYRFTDVSDAFLANARARFASHPNVEYGTFDLELDPEAQDYAPGSFDLVVSANCVHAVKDLRAALLRLKSLLAPGGVLLLIESTTHLDYFDMTTGLIEGWQHFADDLRGNDPLLPPETWVTALLAAGMSEAKAWPERGTTAEAVAQHVIVAVAPGRAAPAHARARASDAAATEASPAATATEQATVGAVRRRLEEATPSEHLSILCDVVRTEVTRILRLDPSTPPARSDRLMDLGMDSLMAVQLRNSLDRAMSLERGKGLPSTLMFDYPTIEAIAEFLLARFAPATAPSHGDDRYAKPADGPAPLDASAIAELDDEQIANLLAAREGGS
jgi:SAM-dependent methyltransferase